ncbi:MAG TPA: hypothetical protein VHU41_20740 [Thermoanaerobaculia bacterium]|nr:hypothetical protein [Thermoanaerobaculia bacterium]
MRDITSPRLLVLKAVLFLIVGVAAAGILIAEAPRLSIVLLLAIVIWAFARAYYFAFYVIERYIDSRYKFTGIWSSIVFLNQRRIVDRSLRHVERPLERRTPRPPASAPPTQADEASAPPGV